MRISIPALVIAGCVAVVPLAHARGGMGGGAHAGGPAMRGEATANSNGRFASDRDKGLDRAEDRRSAEGIAHAKSADASKRPTSHARRPESGR